MDLPDSEVGIVCLKRKSCQVQRMQAATELFDYLFVTDVALMIGEVERSNCDAGSFVFGCSPCLMMFSFPLPMPWLCKRVLRVSATWLSPSGV